MGIKNILVILLLSITTQEAFSQGSFSDLFKNPYPAAQVTTRGQSGSGIAKLAEGCKKMKNALMPYNFLFQLQYQYGFHSHLMAIDLAKSPSPPFFAPWFNLAIPGVAGSQEDPIIMKVCDILIQFDNHGVAKGLFATGDFLNDMTGGQFDAELTLADKLYNASNSVYDLQTGAPRKGALRSAYVHKQLIDAASASKSYYNQRFGDGSSEGLESEAARRQKLDRLAQLSYERAVLKEASRCPTPQGNTDFQQKYANYIPPRQARVQLSDQDIDFFYKTLLKLGPEMISSVEELDEYNKMTNKLVHQSARFTSKPEKYTETDKAVTSKLDKNGKPIKRDKKVSKTIYIYTPLMDQQFINSYRNKYVKKWEKFITAQMLVSGTTGLFSGKKGRIEEKFKDYSFECSERRLGMQVSPRDRNDPLYHTNLRILQETCRENLKVRDAEYKNLMDSYVQRLTLAITIRNKNLTEIWNFEARELGFVRVLKDSSRDAKAQKAEIVGSQGQEVSCSTDLTPAEMKMIQNKAKANNLALKEEWVRQKVEASVNDDIEREQQVKRSKNVHKQGASTKQKIKNSQEGSGGKKVNVNVDVRKAL